MYKFNKDMLPIVFDGWFVSFSTSHNRNTRQSDLYRLHTYKKDVRKFSLRIQGGKLWNTLPSDIRNKNTLNAFKISLKKFLLDSQENENL